jgi:DNA-binding NtrC family response regulator
MAVTARQAEAQSLFRIFSNANWRLESVSSIAEAMERLRESRLSVILCADELPDGAWPDLLRAVRSLGCACPFLLISHSLDDTVWQEALAHGAYDVLPVPLNATEVFRAISMAWRQWKAEAVRRGITFETAKLKAQAAGSQS